MVCLWHLSITPSPWLVKLVIDNMFVDTSGYLLWIPKKLVSCGRLKKNTFFKTVHTQYFFAKLSGIGPWVSMINWCKGHQCESTESSILDFIMLNPKTSSERLLGSKDGSKFWWLPWFPPHLSQHLCTGLYIITLHAVLEGW